MSKMGNYFLGIQESAHYKYGWKLADGGEPRPNKPLDGSVDAVAALEEERAGWDAFHSQGPDEPVNPHVKPLTEHNSLLYQFGEELMFAAQGLRTQPAGTVAKFSIEVDGYYREVSVVAKATP